MTLRIATQEDTEVWAGLRARLWKDTSLDVHRSEIAELLARPRGESIAFLEGVPPRAFAEASLRRDHVDGCDTSPVAFLEGIYVNPEDRGHGIGRRLLAAVRDWAREIGCSELGSDAELANTASHAFHEASGFEETSRVVFFRMRL
ncbi:aminoglycoside 6'-N-acetyltransferase [Histidinibacterium aquaticum]|uniref:Aminoglycoside N(6')-acetyltransferase type 1 n=1 Tax=Histidinibacterium aquaticum TaxID=2613962 RepID=A0A5J5GLS2_9RHOB|nr:aminoglycoside 6'-N-acetyltransferase [Histidinibacterium aquaticum]KAA9009100.1 GNAT family N-acetyltransferase [Histidinibacterium aquaticum]